MVRGQAGEGVAMAAGTAEVAMAEVRVEAKVGAAKVGARVEDQPRCLIFTQKTHQNL